MRQFSTTGWFTHQGEVIFCPAICRSILCEDGDSKTPPEEDGERLRGVSGVFGGVELDLW